jgi:hypothetical protein
MDDQVKECIESINPKFENFGISINFNSITQHEGKHIVWIFVKGKKDLLEATTKLNISAALQFFLRSKLAFNDITVAISEYITTD